MYIGVCVPNATYLQPNLRRCAPTMDLLRCRHVYLVLFGEGVQIAGSVQM